MALPLPSWARMTESTFAAIRRVGGEAAGSSRVRRIRMRRTLKDVAGPSPEPATDVQAASIQRFSRPRILQGGHRA